MRAGLHFARCLDSAAPVPSAAAARDPPPAVGGPELVRAADELPSKASISVLGCKLTPGRIADKTSERLGAGPTLTQIRIWPAARLEPSGWVFPTPSHLEHVIIEQVPASVLIVDDDPIFRALARRMLMAAGLVVVAEAENVAEGLSVAEQLRPNAALVDFGLPDGDGLGLARQLTALPWRPRVVLTSVESDIGSDGEVRSTGAEAFVPKADLPNAPLARLLGGE